MKEETISEISEDNGGLSICLDFPDIIAIIALILSVIAIKRTKE
ncbi:MAG: hypothetical protein PHV39_02595 [Methanomicrobium sp.]|nr:hypothetical protein [Methanomicrobium sp.]